MSDKFTYREIQKRFTHDNNYWTTESIRIPESHNEQLFYSIFRNNSLICIFPK